MNKLSNIINKNNINSINKYKHKIIPTLLLSYIGLRHILPKKDMIINGDNGYGDKVVGYSRVNCILFDEVEIWYDGDIVFKINRSYWRRINIMIE